MYPLVEILPALEPASLSIHTLRPSAHRIPVYTTPRHSLAAISVAFVLKKFTSFFSESTLCGLLNNGKVYAHRQFGKLLVIQDDENWPLTHATTTFLFPFYFASDNW